MVAWGTSIPLSPWIKSSSRRVREVDAPPESRFRFASKCVEERCAYWTEGECAAIELALAQDS